MALGAAALQLMPATSNVYPPTTISTSHYFLLTHHKLSYLSGNFTVAAEDTPQPSNHTLLLYMRTQRLSSIQHHCSSTPTYTLPMYYKLSPQCKTIPTYSIHHIPHLPALNSPPPFGNLFSNIHPLNQPLKRPTLKHFSMRHHYRPDLHSDL